MKIARGSLLSRLNEASIGLSSKEVLEQSNSFVFKDGRLTTFNDDIMVRVASPLDFDVVVNASDLMGILAKIPDDEITIVLKDGELRIKSPSKTRAAGIGCSTEVALPLDAVPTPGKWFRLAEGINGIMQQAARTCGNDEARYLTTCVHATPKRIEACDDERMFRVDLETGFPDEVLIPAASVHELERIEISRVAIGKGWVHFKTTAGAEISIRCSHEKYHPNVDDILKMNNPVKLVLPAELGDTIERAEVFHTAAFADKIGVRISNNELTITSRKENGWYKERQAVAYKGRELAFEIQPQFLVEVLARTRDVLVDDRKMKIANDKVQFIVSLLMKPPQEEGDEDETPVTGKAAMKKIMKGEKV